VRTLEAVPAGALVLLAVVFAPGAAHATPMSISPQQAYDLGEVPSPRPVAMGGALNALGVSTNALFLNPANLPLARVYHIEAFAAYTPESTGQTYGAAIVDSLLNTGHLSGGFAATWSEFDPTGMHRTWTDVRAALALPLGDRFSFGVTGRWIRVDQALGAGPFQASLASDGSGSSPLFNRLTFDVGATATPVDGLRVAVVGHNLTNPGTSLAPTTGAAGIGYFTPLFALEADGLLDFTTWGGTRGRLMGGGEVFLADRYAIRAGWRYDAGTKINAPSVGFGYIDPRWSVEIAFRHDLISEHASSLGVLSLRYFYDAIGNTAPLDQPDSL
jgi:hypothetical protein